MRICERAAEARIWSECYRQAGLSVGLVPTLGALHQGHAALLQHARRECERVVASIYLNPTQFNSPADLETYPRTRQHDLDVCREQGVDLVFLGETEDLLPDGFQSHVEVEELTRPLCGKFRPGHFRGVTTVVAQLLHVARPHRAYFGLKDYQQAAVVQRMVKDLNFDTEIRLVPTVREPDGLALSSRNKRLSPREREAARGIYRALTLARDEVRRGEEVASEVAARLTNSLERERELRVEYVEVLDAHTLLPFPEGRIERRTHGVLIAVAVYAGGTRLIDNVVVLPDGG